MDAALHAVIDLQPWLANPAAFANPANAAAIDQDLQTLAALQHEFLAPSEAGKETISGLFADSVLRARADLGAGAPEAARARLRGVTGLCFACHSRERVAKDFQDASGSVDKLNLPPLRKAEFFATTRQFDRAIAIWNQALSSAPQSETDRFEQATALRQYLSVLIRVKDDRDATVALLVRQAARPELPMFLRRAVEQWLADAKQWQADKFDANAATPTALVAKATAIVDASAAARTPLSDERQYVGLLRASGYLHRALEAEPRGKFRGEALYLLGVASAASMDPLLWDLDNLYLETCVRENPHTRLAMRCANRMYDRAWFGWTGSGGSHLPPDILKRLGQLQDLAADMADPRR